VAEVVEAVEDEEGGKGEAVEEDGDGVEVYIDEWAYAITNIRAQPSLIFHQKPTKGTGIYKHLPQ
jgi:hypothetical protein